MNARLSRLKSLRRKRVILALVAVAALLTIAAGTTLAWLAAESPKLINTFGAAEITCEVKETFTGGVKSNVSIRNTGTMDAYIRAALVPVWKDGSSVAGTPATLADCTMDWGGGYGTSWVHGADGYYYCTLPIPAGGDTPILIDECSGGARGDYRFELQISAQAVQALPVTCVTQTWESTVTSVLQNGMLEVDS